MIVVRRSWIVLALLAGLPYAGPARGQDAPARPPDLVLLTLDTTRADALGVYRAAAAGSPAAATPASRTPVLDALAAAGIRYARALTVSPLTLPAHASLLTGLAPPEHGLRENGTAALGPGIPTLATVLAGRGYATGAFVASRVLDRRFGLDRGFGVYDDRMSAEEIGEYGYPERDAAAVTDAALAWLADLDPARPFFLWLHYYDPHAPYAPPAELRGAGEHGDYAGEVAYVDREIGRLLAAVRRAPRWRVIAAVGDHGEALGEHGERTHGIFLYRSVLEVPLILAGPGVAAGAVVEEPVATRRLASTLLRLLGAGDAAPGFGPALPLPEVPADPQPIYSETWMPAGAYGWAPLTAVTHGRWRLIRAPRPELYDFVADPSEHRNLVTTERDTARRAKRALETLEAGFEPRAPAPLGSDPELQAELRSLGYLTGSREAGTIDPKDGIAMLAELERAKTLLAAGRAGEAVAVLEPLVERNPGNVPFLTQLARARLASGRTEAALATFRRAVERNPGLDFLHLHLAEAYRLAGRVEEARRAYERTLELNPRAAGAWLALAELHHRAGEPEAERRLLERATDAGTASAAILVRLGQLEAAAGEGVSARARLRAAVELAPSWDLPWLILGQLHHAAGETAAARAALERAAALGHAGPVGREARRLLSRLPESSDR